MKHLAFMRTVFALGVQAGPCGDAEREVDEGGIWIRATIRPSRTRCCDCLLFAHMTGGSATINDLMYSRMYRTAPCWCLVVLQGLALTGRWVDVRRGDSWRGGVQQIARHSERTTSRRKWPATLQGGERACRCMRLKQLWCLRGPSMTGLSQQGAHQPMSVATWTNPVEDPCFRL